jgi:carbon starvation protein
MLAGLTLALATVYLRSKRWPIWPTAIPGVFVLGATLAAMLGNLATMKDPLLLGVGCVLLLLGFGVVFEAGLALRRAWR